MSVCDHACMFMFDVSSICFNMRGQKVRALLPLSHKTLVSQIYIILLVINQPYPLAKHVYICTLHRFILSVMKSNYLFAVYDFVVHNSV